MKKKEKIQDLIRQQQQKKGTGNREQEIVLMQNNGDPLSLSHDDHDAPFYLSLLSLSDFGQMGGVPLLIRSNSRFLSTSQAYVHKSSEDDPLKPPSAPLSRSEKRQQKLDSHESLYFLFFTEAMVILRPLYLSEHILQLVIQKNFSLALHLCQKYKRCVPNCFFFVSRSSPPHFVSPDSNPQWKWPTSSHVTFGKKDNTSRPFRFGLNQYSPLLDPVTGDISLSASKRFPSIQKEGERTNEEKPQPLSFLFFSFFVRPKNCTSSKTTCRSMTETCCLRRCTPKFSIIIFKERYNTPLLSPVTPLDHHLQGSTILFHRTTKISVSGYTAGLWSIPWRK